MRRSVVRLENVWAEQIFQWAYDSMKEASGDGGSAIVCDNYKEAAEWFKEWMRKEALNRYFLYMEELYPNIITFTYNQEAILFSDDPSLDLFEHDNIYIVVEDCPFGFKRDQYLRGIK